MRFLPVLATALALAPSAPAAERRAPRLVVAETVHDFGVVGPGQRLEHGFVLRNDGTAVLQVTGVAAACGCTIADYDREIAAGATGAVRAAVDTTLFRPGPFLKTVEVQTDDPALPHLTLTLRGDLQPHVLTVPNRLRFAVAADGRGGEVQTVVVSSAARSDLEVTAVETTSPWIVATIREMTAADGARAGAGRAWRLEVRLASPLEAGPIRGEVRLRTNHPDQPVAVVPLSGFVAAHRE